MLPFFSFFFQAEDGIRDGHVTGVQTCALPISCPVVIRSGLPCCCSVVCTVYCAPRPCVANCNALITGFLLCSSFMPSCYLAVPFITRATCDSWISPCDFCSHR